MGRASMWGTRACGKSGRPPEVPLEGDQGGKARLRVKRRPGRMGNERRDRTENLCVEITPVLRQEGPGKEDIETSRHHGSVATMSPAGGRCHRDKPSIGEKKRVTRAGAAAFNGNFTGSKSVPSQNGPSPSWVGMRARKKGD